MDMLKHRETARVLSKCRCLHLFVFVLFVSAVPLSLDGCFVRVLCLRSCCVCVFGILFIMHWCFSHFVEFLFASFRKHIYIIKNTHFHFMIHSVGPFKQQEAIPSIARSPLGVCHVVCGPVITAEAHVAFAGASQHTDNTAELSGMMVSLLFLSLLEPVPRGSHARIFHGPRHAADVCFGYVQSQTNVRWG